MFDQSRFGLSYDLVPNIEKNSITVMSVGPTLPVIAWNPSDSGSVLRFVSVYHSYSTASSDFAADREITD